MAFGAPQVSFSRNGSSAGGARASRSAAVLSCPCPQVRFPEDSFVMPKAFQLQEPGVESAIPLVFSQKRIYPEGVAAGWDISAGLRRWNRRSAAIPLGSQYSPRETGGVADAQPPAAVAVIPAGCFYSVRSASTPTFDRFFGCGWSHAPRDLWAMERVPCRRRGGADHRDLHQTRWVGVARCVKK